MNSSNQKSFEFVLLIFCFIIPYSFLLPKVGDIFKNFFQRSTLSYFLGFILFSTLPILYDFLYNDLGWRVLIRIVYSSFLFFGFYSRKVQSIPIAQIILYLVIFFPLDLDILPGGAIVLDGGIPLKSVVMGTVPVVFYLYLVVHPIGSKGNNEFGTTFEFKWEHFLISFLGCIVLTITVLPTSFYLDFVNFKEEVGSFSSFIVQLLVFFLAVGIPEEMFFRVLFLYVWKRNFPNGSMLGYLVLSSIFFGLAHVITATPGHPAPNFAYCFLATLFGLMYGAVYLKTKQLFHAALVHAMVDSIWLHWFML
jgi:membrane protease YdiL (CAAX protease family)